MPDGEDGGLRDLTPEEFGPNLGLIPRKEVEEKFDPEKHKSETATYIAKGILYAFGIAIAIALIGNYVILFVILWRGQHLADDFITKDVIPLLTAVGTFGATLFGPLLAFVLGFYFGEAHKEGASTGKQAS